MRISDWSSDVCSSDLLFADATAGVIGAAHAGWKGAIGGVLAATVDAMEKLGADRSRITAAIGPTIARSSYEVADGFRLRLVDADPENERLLAVGRAGHSWFDLGGNNVSLTSPAGLVRKQ